MIDKQADITKFEDGQVPVLKEVIDKICRDGASFRYTDTVPTVATMHEGEVVICDTAAVGTTAGTIGLYVITRSKRIGYITLTSSTA